MCGLQIGRLRAFLDDDAIPVIYNSLVSPTPVPSRPLPIPNIEKLKKKRSVGSFGLFVAIEPAGSRSLPPASARTLLDAEKACVVARQCGLQLSQSDINYREGMVMLKGVGVDGEETWYVHSMPVEKWEMQVMGHDWGFRKALYDMKVTSRKTTVKEKNG